MDNNIDLKKYGKQVIIAILIAILIITTGILLYYKFSLARNLENIYIYIKPLNESISTITADSSNRFIFKIEVKNKLGEPVSGVPLTFILNSNIGILDQNNARTDKLGEFLVTYIPPDTIPSGAYSEDKKTNNGENEINIINNVDITITAKVSSKANILYNILYKYNYNYKKISKHNIINKLFKNLHDVNEVNNTQAENTNTATGNHSAKFAFKLIQVPVVLVHGYQSTSDIFSNMVAYLEKLGFDTISFDYNSLDGVISGANKLKSFLADQAHKFRVKGIQVKRFDIISHSMGGVISRFYSVHEDYIEFNNIRKLIFISTPHKGSHLAPIGAEYFNDQGVRDMMPESNLYKKMFPQMINRGLNPNIQTGNIIGQFDEVVSIESAGLYEWGIDTNIFKLSDNKFNVDSLLDGTISQNAIHKVILNNKKVYETLVEMLTRTIKYPSKIK